MPDRHDRIEAADLPCTKRPAEDYFRQGTTPAQAEWLCADCPLADPCLHVALTDNLQGVWGGKTEAQRDRMRRRAA